MSADIPLMFFGNTQDEPLLEHKHVFWASSALIFVKKSDESRYEIKQEAWT